MSIQLTHAPDASPRPATSTTSRPRTAVQRTVDQATSWLVRHSITVLRAGLGLVFLAFGALKFVPGASPAEDLAIRTVDTLTLGVVSGGAALLLTAIMECLVGITLLTGRFVRIGLVTLAAAMVGIFSPLVLFFGDIFPAGGPTLEAQYIVKDIVLVAAGLVIAARTLGARLVADDPTNPARGIGHRW